MFWAIIAVILVFVFGNFGTRLAENKSRIAYSTFVKGITANKINQVVLNGQNVRGTTSSGKMFSTYLPWKDPFLVDKMLSHDIKITAAPPPKQSLLVSIFISWFPFLLLIGVWIFLMKKMQGGKGGAFTFGRSKAKLLEEDKIKVTLKDVAGIEEAKEEVAEIVDFLKSPAKYHKIGGKIPRGILMVGSPGTGKTLLARAIAGETKVPFFSISGSDFVEMFVGVGASRVRDMFAQAKKRSPCIIFIDEIDAVGRHRGTGLGGGHDEREQTLNQLLVEMDGFDDKEGVIVLAATNRPDVLDPALLRPGRFDRQVTISLPDIKGRDQILTVHMKNIKTTKDVDTSVIARGTPGFSGADLANLVNESALFAARSNKPSASMHDFDMAKDKILMGTERRSMVMSEQEKLLTAYHESGHAIIGKVMPEHDPIYKVTIIPRGRALGVTMYLPERDQVSYSRTKLESQLASIYGGRVAEELIFGAGKVTTGASNDIEKATEIARSMVTKWGLSDALGPLNYSTEEAHPFLGQSMARNKHVISDRTTNLIDEEVKSLISRAYETAKKVLSEHLQILHNMSAALMQYETLDAEQVALLMTGDSLGVGEVNLNDNAEIKKTSPKKKKASSASSKKKSSE